MKKVYVAHPFRGKKPYTLEGCRENMQEVSDICRRIFEAGEVIPISPMHAFCYLDPLDSDQQKVLESCLALMDACDEVWMFGDYSHSQGCKAEIAHAKEKGIPVRLVPDRVYLPDTSADYNRLR